MVAVNPSHGCYSSYYAYFQNLGLRCVSFLDQIIPGIILVMHSRPPSQLDFYFQQLGSLISIVKQHIRPHVEKIYGVIRKFPIIKLQITIISVIESISKALEGEFKRFSSRDPNLFP